MLPAAAAGRASAGWLMRVAWVAWVPQLAQAETEIRRMASAPAKP